MIEGVNILPGIHLNTPSKTFSLMAQKGKLNFADNLYFKIDGTKIEANANKYNFVWKKVEGIVFVHGPGKRKTLL